MRKTMAKKPTTRRQGTDKEPTSPADKDSPQTQQRRGSKPKYNHGDSNHEGTKAKNKGGRPSLYTDKLLEEICRRLSTGEPLTVICGDDHMPCDDTVRDWADADKSGRVAREIARARARGYDAIANRARETARGKGDSTNDVQRDKLIVDTDLKLLAKWDPKRYGDRQQVDHGLQKGNPIENLLGAIAGKTFVPVANPPQDDDEA